MSAPKQRKLTDQERQAVERKLRAKHEPRYMKRDVDRICKFDEDQIIAQVRARESDDKAATAAVTITLIGNVEQHLAEIHERFRRHHRLDKHSYRDLDNARRACAHLREVLTAKA